MIHVPELVTLLALVTLSLLAGAGCTGIAYRDTVTPDGLTNLHRVVPGVLRVAHPDTLAKWVSLYERLEAEPHTSSKLPLFVQLHWDYEADDSSFAKATGFELLKAPLYPEDGKPWTVLESSPASVVMVPVRAIVQAKREGRLVAFGCMHDRDRGGVVAAVVKMVLEGITEAQAFAYMQATGSRIEVLPGLLESFLQAAEDVR